MKCNRTQLVIGAKGSSTIRCPKCFGRNFKRDQKKWICEGCGFESNGEDLVDNTPEGCFPAIEERVHERRPTKWSRTVGHVSRS